MSISLKFCKNLFKHFCDEYKNFHSFEPYFRVKVFWWTVLFKYEILFKKSFTSSVFYEKSVKSTRNLLETNTQTEKNSCYRDFERSCPLLTSQKLAINSILTCSLYSINKLNIWHQFLPSITISQDLRPFFKFWILSFNSENE